MNGKSKCKILKQIRRQIAEANDISYITSECKYQGGCTGTCPKCEAEVRYLEEALQKRRSAGKAVAVAGIAATLMLGATGCQSILPTYTTAGDVAFPTDPTVESTVLETEPTETLPELMGKPVIEDELAGVPPLPSEDHDDLTFPPGVQGEIAIPEP